MVEPAVLEKLEAAWKKLCATESKSLLKKYLTQEIFDKLKTKKTSFNSSLLDVIQSGELLHCLFLGGWCERGGRVGERGEGEKRNHLLVIGKERKS